MMRDEICSYTHTTTSGLYVYIIISTNMQPIFIQEFMISKSTIVVNGGASKDFPKKKESI